MRRYFIKRILQAVITIVLIMILIFFLARALGDPAVLFLSEDAGQEQLALLRENFGLDKPIWVQFVRVFFLGPARGLRPFLQMGRTRLGPGPVQGTGHDAARSNSLAPELDHRHCPGRGHRA